MSNRTNEAYFFETPSDYLEFLQHYGTKRHSGRFPYGSGDNPFQHEGSWYSHVKELRSQGLSDNDIARLEGISSTEFRARVSNARAEERAEARAMAIKLKDHGYSTSEIARRMYGSASKESTVRSLLNEERAKRNDLNRETADTLKKFVDQKRYLDVGAGTELELGVSEERLKKAISLLEKEGYKKQYLRIPQMGTNHKTTLKVLTKDDVPWSELNEHKYEVQTIGSKIIDIDGKREPAMEINSVDSGRVFIRYGDKGGAEKDGLIEIRRGVDDISLGAANYAQVRIGVDGKYYMKGMCCYGDIPKGYDLVYNTNKVSGTPPEKVYKPMKIDKDNPFGASLKMDDDDVTLTQRYYYDKDGNKKISAINVVNEEGDWAKWGKSLASQMLSKQNLSLAKKQLNLDYANKLDEFDDICKLNNKTIKRVLLQKFADGCDAAAVDLKAAPLPRQATHVLIPVPSLKENEIYAPNYRDGEQVCLIRYPHGGVFEIPTLTVKNKGSDAEPIIGKNAPDAVGINAKVAERLSGADFDGDTAVVIPVGNNVKIRTSRPLPQLVGFDPKKAYPKYDGMEVISNRNKQTEMGKVTNLITDMTLIGAPEHEIARAVKHSMVIIDAEKHELNYKQSYIDNGIAALKEKYQGHANAGAGTIISRAGGRYDVPARKDHYRINPETGEKIFIPTNEYKKAKDKNGNWYTTDKLVTQESKKMLEYKDAYELTSGGSKANPGHPMEDIYANYANQMKALGNKARKELMATGKLEQNKEAKKIYAEERASLISKLNRALKNAPMERQAQLYAGKLAQRQIDADPSLDNEHKQKIRGQALVTARKRVGAKKIPIDITDREWKAIQAGAISDTQLMTILDNTKLEDIRARATPRSNEVSSAKQARIKAMMISGYSTSEIADACGVSVSTVQKYGGKSAQKK